MQFWICVVGLLVPMAFVASAEAAQDRTLMLTNNSTLEVTAFKVKTTDSSAEPSDVLTGQSLPTGTNRMVTIASPTDECVFDLEIEFSAGSVEKREAVDFCNTDGYIIEKQ